MKKQLKILSLVLSIALLLISAAPFTVNAFDSINMDDNAELITPSDNAIYSVWGNAAPASLCQELTALNVTVTANTLIEILPLTSGSGTALTVTNASNSTIIKDFIFGLGDNGHFSEILPIDDGTAELMAGTNIGYPDDMSLVKASAVYNIVYSDTQYLPTGALYQPLGSYFFYYADGVHDVTYVHVDYTCIGFEYTYPGLEALSGNIPTSYHAPITKYNPVSNAIYSNTNAYPSNKALQLNPPLGAVQTLYINITVDGTTIEDGISFEG